MGPAKVCIRRDARFAPAANLARRKILCPSLSLRNQATKIFYALLIPNFVTHSTLEKNRGEGVMEKKIMNGIIWFILAGIISVFFIGLLIKSELITPQKIQLFFYLCFLYTSIYFIIKSFIQIIKLRRKEEISYSHKVLTLSFITASLMSLLVTAFIIAWVITLTSLQANDKVLLLAIGIYFLIWFIVHYVVGIGILKSKHWAYTIILPLVIICLIQIPLISLPVLFNPAGSILFLFGFFYTIFALMTILDRKVWKGEWLEREKTKIISRAVICQDKK
jgi:hypothetical protein